MKYFFSIIFISISISAVSQAKTGATYNTHIDKATNVKIYLHNKVVIGTVVVNNPTGKQLNPTVYLSNVTQTKDSSGYTTTILFNNPGHPVLNDCKINLKFDKPIISAQIQGFNGQMVMLGLSEDKMEYNFSADEMHTQSTFQIVIKSKEPVFTTISGLDFIFI